MKILKMSAVVLAVTAPVLANAQINQLFGALQSAQNAASQARQFLPQQSGQDSMADDQRMVANAQVRQAAMQQQAQQQKQQDETNYRAELE